MIWVTLKVSDLERSVAFYTETLELEVASRFGGKDHEIVMLGSGGGPKVELICEAGVAVESPGNGVSFGLETDDLDELIRNLEEKGYPLVGPIAPDAHIRFFFVKDPDGYTVQLVERK